MEILAINYSVLVFETKSDVFLLRCLVANERLRHLESYLHYHLLELFQPWQLFWNCIVIVCQVQTIWWPVKFCFVFDLYLCVFFVTSHAVKSHLVLLFQHTLSWHLDPDHVHEISWLSHKVGLTRASYANDVFKR